MHQYLWLFRKLHIKKRQQLNISELHSLLTQKLWQGAITDVYSDTALTHPLCPPSLQTKPSTKLADLPGSVSLSHGLFHLRCWAGALAENQGEQYLAGEKSFPLLWKKGRLTTAALPAPLLLLPLSLRRNQLPLYHLPLWCRLYWGYGIILAIFNSTELLCLFLPFLPALHKTSWYLHSILRKKLDLLQHREVWKMS